MRGRIALIAFLCSCALCAQTDSLLHEVRVTAQRGLSEAGIQRTTLDTAILHQNVALSMSDILTQPYPGPLERAENQFSDAWNG